MINLGKIKAPLHRHYHSTLNSSIVGRDHESGSHFNMPGIPEGEVIWKAKRFEDLEIHGANFADLDFIANARHDVPVLIAEIERLQNLIYKP